MALPRTLHANGFRAWHIAMAVLLGVFAVVAARSAWFDLYRIALNDEESSQVILAPFLAAWLFWCRRGRVRSLVRRRVWLGPVIVGLGAVAHVVGNLAFIETAWYSGAILMLVGVAVTAFGAGVLTRFAPAFFVLLFLIPVPGMIRLQIAGPLQTATAGAVQNFFVLTGMDVTRSGNLLYVNGNPVTVAEACNGMRMTFALILVTFTYVFSTPMQLWVRVCLVVLSPAIAIMCNVVRLIPTLLAYGYMQEHWADFIHDWGGWVMLGIALMVLMGVINLLRWLDLPIYAYSRASRH